MKNKIILLFVILIVSIYGCDIISSNKDKPGLNAVVRDENGNRINDVKVYVIYDFPTEEELLPDDGYYKLDKSGEVPTKYAFYQNYPIPFKTTSAIQFALPFESIVTITLSEYDSDNVIHTLYDGEILNAGFYQIIIPNHINNVIINNGLYKIQAQIIRDGELVFNDYVLSYKLNADFNEINKMDPVELTDSNGEFSISYDSIPFGIHLNRTSALGPEIIGSYELDNTIIIMLMKESYLNIVEKVTFDPEKSVTEEFIMKK